MDMILEHIRFARAVARIFMVIGWISILVASYLLAGIVGALFGFGIPLFILGLKISDGDMP